MTAKRPSTFNHQSKESNLIVCLTHSDQSQLRDILKCLAKSPSNRRQIAHLPVNISPKSEPTRTCLRLEEIDASLNQKIVAHQKQAASQSQQSLDLKRLSRKIIQENKELMSRSSFILESSRGALTNHHLTES